MHAWIGEGSLKVLNEALSSAGMLSCENAVTGVTGGTPSGVVIVIECFLRKASTSAGLAVDVTLDGEAALDGAEEVSADVVGSDVDADSSSFLRRFFSFFSFLGSEVLASVVGVTSSVSECFLFFFFFLSELSIGISGGGMSSVNLSIPHVGYVYAPSASTNIDSSTSACFFFFFFFFSVSITAGSM